MPLQDQFWGDRYGLLTDPYGYNWSMAAHIADYTEEELKAATEKAFSQMQSA
jgi:PhnB protein